MQLQRCSEASGFYDPENDSLDWYQGAPSDASAQMCGMGLDVSYKNFPDAPEAPDVSYGESSFELVDDALEHPPRLVKGAGVDASALDVVHYAPPEPGPKCWLWWCWPISMFMLPKPPPRLIHIQNNAEVDIFVIGILIPDDGSMVVKDLAVNLAAAPAVEVKAAYERAIAQLSDKPQENDVNAGDDLRMPMRHGAKGMQLFLFNKADTTETLGSASVDAGAIVTVKNEPINRAQRSQAYAMLKDNLGHLP